MTITSTVNRVSAAGPGNDFVYNKPVFDFVDMYVEISTDADVLIIPVQDGAGTYDFTVAGTFDAASFRYPAGVTVTLNNDLPTDFTIVIENRVQPLQESDYLVGGAIPAERLETDLDRLAVMAQAANTIFDDLVKVSPTAGIVVTPLVPTALELLRWNAAGDDIETISLAELDALVIPVGIADGGTGATTAAAARTALGSGATGDAVFAAATAAAAQQAMDTEVGVDVQAFDADTLKADTSDSLTVGFVTASLDLGNLSTATTLTIADRAIQHAGMTGSFTLTAPDDTDDGYMELEMTIDATGGYTLTLSGFNEISGAFDSTALAVNLLRVSKLNTNTYLEITQAV